jgi:DNA-binding MarR family transcriptional regulator
VNLRRTIGCHCLAARRSARAITRLYEDRLRAHDLRATQFSILAALSLTGPTPITELAELLGLDRTSLTRSAGVLEGRRWIQTVRSGDPRERPLDITREGRTILDAAYPAWLEVQEMIDRGEWTPSRASTAIPPLPGAPA